MPSEAPSPQSASYARLLHARTNDVQSESSYYGGQNTDMEMSTSVDRLSVSAGPLQIGCLQYPRVPFSVGSLQVSLSSRYSGCRSWRVLSRSEQRLLIGPKLPHIPSRRVRTWSGETRFGQFWNARLQSVLALLREAEFSLPGVYLHLWRPEV